MRVAVRVSGPRPVHPSGDEQNPAEPPAALREYRQRRWGSCSPTASLLGREMNQRFISSPHTHTHSSVCLNVEVKGLNLFYSSGNIKTLNNKFKSTRVSLTFSKFSYTVFSLFTIKGR